MVLNAQTMQATEIIRGVKSARPERGLSALAALPSLPDLGADSKAAA